MTLNSCLLKYQHLLRDFDTSEIMASAKAYIDAGKSEQEAARLAVDEKLEEVNDEIARVEKEIAAQYNTSGAAPVTTSATGAPLTTRERETAAEAMRGEDRLNAFTPLIREQRLIAEDTTLSTAARYTAEREGMHLSTRRDSPPMSAELLAQRGSRLNADDRLLADINAPSDMPALLPRLRYVQDDQSNWNILDEYSTDYVFDTGYPTREALGAAIRNDTMLVAAPARNDRQPYAEPIAPRRAAAPASLATREVESNFVDRGASAMNDGVLEKMGDFWKTVMGGKGQRVLTVNTRNLKGRGLSQAQLNKLKDKYNVELHKQAAVWAEANNKPLPTTMFDPVVAIETDGRTVGIRVRGLGRNGQNPYLAVTPDKIATAQMYDNHINSTGLERAAGSADIGYRLFAEMAVMQDQGIEASSVLLTNNNIRRHVQSVYADTLFGPGTISPMEPRGRQSGQGVPQGLWEASTPTERIGLNMLRLAHSVSENRYRAGTLAAFTENLQYQRDGTIVAVTEPREPNGFERGAVVTDEMLLAKLRERTQTDSGDEAFINDAGMRMTNAMGRTTEGGVGVDTAKLAIMTNTVLGVIEGNVDKKIPGWLVTLAKQTGRDIGGWMFSRTVTDQDATGPATRNDLLPGNISDLLNKTDWAILTAENADAKQMSTSENAVRMGELRADLKKQGFAFEEADGKYGNEEHSVVVIGITEAQAQAFGKKYSQESVVVPKGLLYQDGSYHEATGVTEHTEAPADFYTKISAGGALFTIDINFDEKQQSEVVKGETVAGVHFSDRKRDTLDTTKYGEGMKGAEAQRIDNGGIKERTMFYVDEGSGINPESGVGRVEHRVKLENMYNTKTDDEGLVAANPNNANAWEQAIVDAGYNGYYAPGTDGNQGNAVVLGKKLIPVPLEGAPDLDAGQEVLSSRGVDFDPTRRRFVMGMAAALVTGNVNAGGLTLGKAKPVSEAIMGAQVPPEVASILRGNGETHPNGAGPLKKALNLIASTGPKEVRALAAEIAKLLPDSGFMLTVDDDGLWNANGAVSLGPTPHLQLFTAEGRSGLTYETLLHEALHAAVAARYVTLSSGLIRSNDAVMKVATPKAAKALQQFNALFDEFRHLVDRDVLSNAPAGSELRLSLKEARSSPDEFFVRALTDPHLQAWMATQKYRGRTLFERFKDWVKEGLFWWSKAEGVNASWLDAALVASQDLNVAMVVDKADFKWLGAQRRLTQAQHSTLRDDGGDTLFSRTAGDILNSIAPVAPANPNELNIVNLSSRSGGAQVEEKLRASLQDKHVTLRRIQQLAGVMAEQIKLDTMGALDRLGSKMMAKHRELVKVPLQQIEDIMTKAGFTAEEGRASIDSYIKHLHVAEYNAHIATRNPATYDATGKRIKGFDNLHPGSGITDQAASAEIARLESLPSRKATALKDANKVYRKMIDDLQKYAVKRGLEKQETVDTWKVMFPNYTPFNRDLDIDVNVSIGSVVGTKEFSMRAGISRAAMGSGADIVSPLAASLLLGDKIVRRGENAIVARTVLEFAKNFIPNYKDATGEWKPMWTVGSVPDVRVVKEVNVYEVRKADGTMSMEFYNRDDANAHADMLQSVWVNANPNTDQNASGITASKKYPTPQKRVVMQAQPNILGQANVFVVPVDGENKIVTFDEGSEDAMNILNALKGNDTNKLSASAWLTLPRMFSQWTVAMATGFNPVFIVFNIARDIPGAAINMGSHGIPGWKASDSLALLHKIPRAAPELYARIRSEWESEHSNAGALPPAPRGTTAWWYDKAVSSGGVTGVRESFADLESAETQLRRMYGQDARVTPLKANEVENWLTKMNGGLARIGDSFYRVGEGTADANKVVEIASKSFASRIAHANNAAEASTRTLVFKHATEKFMAAGHTEAEAMKLAANVSKNISTNFNRRGSSTALFNQLFPFFNAAVQGSARLAETIFEKHTIKTVENGRIVLNQKTRFTPYGKRVFASTLSLGALQAVILAAADFEDDEPPKEIKDRAFILPTGDGGYIAIPMPHGFNVLVNFGREMTDAVMSSDNRGKHIANALWQGANFSPTGASGNILYNISPAILDPIIGGATGLDAFGRPIGKEDLNPRDPTPGFTRAKEGASTAGRRIAEGLNWISGGNEDQAGSISPTPDMIDFLIGNVGGGLGREIAKTVRIGANVASSAMGNEVEDIPIYKVPLIGRLVGDVDSPVSLRSRMFTISKELNRLDNRYEGFVDREEFDKADTFKAAHPELEMRKEFERFARSDAKQRKARAQARGNDEIGEVNRITAEQDEGVAELLKRYKEAVDAE